MTDEQIIKAISDTSNEKRRLEALKCLFLNQTVRQQLKAFVLKKGGNLEDAKDIWHVAIIELEKSIRAGRFKAQGTLAGYLFGIGKNSWLVTLRKKRLLVSQEQIPLEIEDNDPETLFLLEEKKLILEEILVKIGPPCDKILKLRSLKYTHQEIAEAMGYPKVDNAKKNDYRCRMRLRTFIQEHPHYLNLIKE